MISPLVSRALMPRQRPAQLSVPTGPVAQPVEPFLWQGNQAVAAADLARQRRVADALRPQGVPTGPWSLVGDLADEGVANLKSGQADEAERQAQKAVTDALAHGDYEAVLENDNASPQQAAIAQALWQQDRHEADPDTQLDRRYKEAQIDALNNKSDLTEVSPNATLYDPKTNTAVFTAPGAAGGDDTVDMIVQSIVNGNQPPDLKGLYGKSAAVRAGLEKQGYDFTKANQDWTATQKLLSTMNGPTQVRLRQAVNQVDDSLPLIENLAKQWKGGGFPILNKVNLVAAKNGAYGADAQSLATQLDGEIADVAAELATVYRGGNTATDSALEQAGKQFSADWSESTLLNAIQLAKVNVAYRKNSLNLSTAGIAASQYNPMQEGPADQPAVGPAGVTSAAPAGGDIAEGTVIEDNNGNRMVLKGGQWVPVP